MDRVKVVKLFIIIIIRVYSHFNKIRNSEFYYNPLTVVILPPCPQGIEERDGVFKLIVNGCPFL